MSRVTNIILTAAAGELQIETLNTLWDFDKCPKFEDASSVTSAGCKHLECNVYLGAFNHLDFEAFKATVEKVAWD